MSTLGWAATVLAVLWTVGLVVAFALARAAADGDRTDRARDDES